VSAGTDYTCGIERDTGSLHCWGKSDDEWSPSIPRRAPTTGAWDAVFAAEFRACAIQREDKTLHCWGVVYGVELDPQVPLLGGAPLAAAWVGDRMVCGLHADTGAALCDVYTNPPGTFVDIGEACGLRADGTLLCWGGDPDVAAAPKEPFHTLGSGNDFTHCGLRAPDRHPVCWNYPSGWLDRAPKQPFQELAVGWGFACGIGEGGSPIVCWGEEVKEFPELSSPFAQ